MNPALLGVVFTRRHSEMTIFQGSRSRAFKSYLLELELGTKSDLVESEPKSDPGNNYLLGQFQNLIGTRAEVYFQFWLQHQCWLRSLDLPLSSFMTLWPPLVPFQPFPFLLKNNRSQSKTIFLVQLEPLRIFCQSRRQNNYLLKLETKSGKSYEYLL